MAVSPRSSLMPSDVALANLVRSLPPSLTEVNIPLSNNAELAELMVDRLPRLRSLFATSVEVRSNFDSFMQFLRRRFV